MFRRPEEVEPNAEKRFARYFPNFPIAESTEYGLVLEILNHYPREYIIRQREPPNDGIHDFKAYNEKDAIEKANEWLKGYSGPKIS